MKENAFEISHLKKTKTREKLLQLLSKATYPISAEELYSYFDKKDTNLSTIYRNLNSFEKAGIIKKEINEKKENVFSLIDDTDSHILVCSICHKRIRLNFCPFEKVNKQIESETGFKLQDQNVELYGICPDCQKAKK